MSLNIRNFRWLVLASLLGASAAYAQSGSVSGSAGTDAAASSSVQEGSTSTAAKARMDADLSASLESQRKAIENKAASVSEKARAKAQAKLDAAAAKVNQAVEKQGEAEVAGRLSSELGVDDDVLMAEQDALGCNWGDLTIAYSVASNANAELSASQLVKVHEAGCGWADVVAGLGLELNSAVRAISSEAKVAGALARGDGRVAVMSGEGARVSAGLKTGVGVGGTGVNAGAGVGIKIGKK